MIKINEAEVLLVSSEPILNNLVQEILNQHNPPVKLWHTPNIQMALNYIFSRGDFFILGKRKAPRLVIVSLSNNEMNGKRFLTVVKNNEITKAVPVIVIGTQKSDADKTDFYRLGANSYLLKPALESDFIQLMKQTIHYWLVLNQPPENIE